MFICLSELQVKLLVNLRYTWSATSHIYIILDLLNTHSHIVFTFLFSFFLPFSPFSSSFLLFFFSHIYKFNTFLNNLKISPLPGGDNTEQYTSLALILNQKVMPNCFRCLQKLDWKDAIVTKFAQIEFRYGDIERGKTLRYYFKVWLSKVAFLMKV